MQMSFPTSRIRRFLRRMLDCTSRSSDPSLCVFVCQCGRHNVIQFYAFYILFCVIVLRERNVLYGGLRLSFAFEAIN